MLSDYNLYLVGLIASAIVWGIKKLAEQNKPMKPIVITILLYAVSLVLSVVFAGFKLPAWTGNVAADVELVLVWVGGYVAMATIIYQVFLKVLLEAGIPAVWRKLTSK